MCIVCDYMDDALVMLSATVGTTATTTTANGMVYCVVRGIERENSVCALGRTRSNRNAGLRFAILCLRFVGVTDFYTCSLRSSNSIVRIVRRYNISLQVIRNQQK